MDSIKGCKANVWNYFKDVFLLKTMETWDVLGHSWGCGYCCINEFSLPLICPLALETSTMEHEKWPHNI